MSADTLLTIGLTTAVSATALGAVALVVGRYVRRPAIVHALWLVVLLKLVVPPILALHILPTAALGTAPVAVPAGTTIDRSLAPTAAGAITVLAAVERGPTRPAALTGVQAVTILWAAGVILALSVGLARGLRFRRAVAAATDPPGDLQARLVALAAELGPLRTPELRVVDACVSPMLWSSPGSTQLLFPRGLLDQLTAAERDALLMHELAHVRRGDDRVRWLELAAAVLFFWHPIVWLARARLRAAEERCCDAEVVRALPDHSRAYADGLLKTVEWLAGARDVRPAFACGAAPVESLKERLTMIVKRRIPARMSTLHRVALVALAVTVLVAFPTWSERATGATNAGEDPQMDAYRADMLVMERQAVALADEITRLELRREELALQMDQRRMQTEMARMQTEADRLEAAGERDAAAALRMKSVHVEHRHAMEVEAQRIQAEARARSIELEHRLRSLQIEVEERAQRGAETAGLHDQMLEIEASLATVSAEARVREGALARELLQREIADLERTAERETIGREQARQLREKAEQLAYQAELLERTEVMESLTYEMEVEMRTLIDEARALEAAGETESAASLMQQIERTRFEAQRRLQIDALKRRELELQRVEEALARPTDH